MTQDAPPVHPTPEWAHAGKSLLLPACVAIVGAIVVMFLAKPSAVTGWDRHVPATADLPAVSVDAD